MRSRVFNERIEFWGYIGISHDGFGGTLRGVGKYKDTWAKVENVSSKSSNLTTEFGILDASNSIIVTMRKRIDQEVDPKVYFIKWRGDNYIIKSQPISINVKDTTIQFICIREREK